MNPHPRTSPLARISHQVPARRLAVLLTLCALAFARPAGAVAEPAASATFPLETIRVDGVERAATREIVVAESRLEPGRAYDEEALRQAIYRIKRLPFVIDAELALEKGSVRDTYVLVIRVELATAVFLEADANWRRVRNPFRDASDRDWFGTLGARQFLGRQGQAFATVDRFRNLQAGYTRYHLFGPGSYATFVAGTNLERTEDGWFASLSTGLPLSLTQTVRATVAVSRGRQIDSVAGSLAWQWNTSDDPLLPTRGAVVEATAQADDSHSVFGGPGLRSRNETLSTALGATARRFLPLSARQAAMGEVSLSRLEARGRTDFGTGTMKFRFDSTRARIGLGYSFDLLRARLGATSGDLRWEAAAGWQTGDGSSAGFATEAFDLSAGLVYRQRWGIVRLSFAYFDDVAPRRLSR